MSGPGRYPSTRVPAEPYRRPKAPDPRALRLDGNEGSRPPASLLAALSGADPSLLRDYPRLDELQEEIARRHGVEPERVVVTAGADDALDRAFRSFLEPGRQVVLPVPTFEMIHRFVAATGGEPVPVPWNRRFPAAEAAKRIGPRTTLVVVVSPNNPTGAVVRRGELEELASAAARAEALVLLDHVYVDYADEDLTAPALEQPNVVVFRTFSKAWGLAGCRVGYALATPEVAAVLRNAGNPYPVAGLSAQVVLARLRQGDADLQAHVARVRDERQRLRRQLRARGIPVPRSQGNFLFPELGERAAAVQQELMRRGVVVRRFPNRPAIAGSLRVTLPGNEADFQILTTALEEVLS